MLGMMVALLPKAWRAVATLMAAQSISCCLVMCSLALAALTIRLLMSWLRFSRQFGPVNPSLGSRPGVTSWASLLPKASGWPALNTAEKYMIGGTLYSPGSKLGA